MDLKWLRENKIIEKIGLPKMIIIVLCGAVLLVTSLPSEIISKDSDDSEETEYTSDSDDASDSAISALSQYEKKQERKLEEILGQIKGVKNVNVMITYASSEEKVTLQNVESDERRRDCENVILDGDDGETPYVVQVIMPQIEGVVIAAEGVDGADKETEIIESVLALFSLETHKIKVIRK